MPSYEAWLGGRYGGTSDARPHSSLLYSNSTVAGVAYLLDNDLLSNRVFAKLNYQALVAGGLEEKRGNATRQP